MPSRQVPQCFKDNAKAVKMVADAYKKKKRAIPWLGSPSYKSTTYFKRVRKLQKHFADGGSVTEAKAWLSDQRI